MNQANPAIIQAVADWAATLRQPVYVLGHRRRAGRTRRRPAGHGFGSLNAEARSAVANRPGHLSRQGGYNAP